MYAPLIYQGHTQKVMEVVDSVTCAEVGAVAAWSGCGLGRGSNVVVG
jgi:hypothetical protein